MKNEILRLVGVLALALLGGFLGAWLFAATGLGDRRTEAYLLDNPEILPRMAEELQTRETERRLAQAGASRSPARSSAIPRAAALCSSSRTIIAAIAG